jgi:hypothetical protein
VIRPLARAKITDPEILNEIDGRCCDVGVSKKPEHFHSRKRARQKQSLREKEATDLASGHKTPEQLQEENVLFAEFALLDAEAGHPAHLRKHKSSCATRSNPRLWGGSAPC